jgi:hypothetical protein
MELTMTPEQREAADRAAELKRLQTVDGQAAEFRDALMQALNAMNLELAGAGVKPNILSVIQALTMLQAEFVAMHPHRNERRMRMLEIEQNLKRLVALKTSVGVKPAAELPPDEQVN